MHDGELLHVVEGLEDLDGEAFCERHRKALEVVVLDELVEVHTQHLEADEDVAAEGE